ncbi:hypothetical protein SCYAM73S_04983 [Streptomyces cyaneofuscatus]
MSLLLSPPPHLRARPASPRAPTPDCRLGEAEDGQRPHRRGVAGSPDGAPH